MNEEIAKVKLLSDQLKQKYAQENKNNTLATQKEFNSYHQMAMILKQQHDELLNSINEQIDRGAKRKSLTVLEVCQILKQHFTIIKLNNIANASIAIYDSVTGIYTQNNNMFYQFFRMVEPALNESRCKDVLFTLNTDYTIKTKSLTHNSNLIPVGNGVYNTDTDKLEPFNSNYVFTTKVATNYNENATTSPNINGWNIEKFMLELANNDHEEEKLLWQIITCVINPNLVNEQAFFLYSEQGSTGKGTFQTLLTNLVGSNNKANLKVTEFNQRFALSRLLGKILCIGDDIEPDTYIKETGNFNSVITRDPVTIEYKGQNAFNTILILTVVQSSNGLPKFNNVEGAKRRLCIVPFNHQFKDDEKNPLVKNNYLYRKDVLEYVLHKALHNHFTKLISPQVVQKAQDEYMQTANSVYAFKHDFWDVVTSKLNIELFPLDYLYSWYKRYCEHASYEAISLRKFSKKFKLIVRKEYHPDTVRLSAADRNELRKINDEELVSFSNSSNFPQNDKARKVLKKNN